MTLSASLPFIASDLSHSPVGFRLWTLLGVSSLLLLTVCVLAFAGMAWRSLRARRLQVAEEQIWRRLAPYLSGREGLVMAAVELVDEFPERSVSMALRRCRREFGGEALDGAAVALAMIGETSRLRETIRSPIRSRRLAAAQCLGDCGGPQAVEGLLELLRHACPETRRVARLSLLRCGNESALRQALASYARDCPAPRRVESGFVRQLVRRAPGLVVEEVRSGELPAAQCRMVLDALADLGFSGSSVLLQDSLSSADPEVRAAAIRLASRLRDWKSRGRILQLLSDDTWYVRASAARALGRLPSDDSVEPLATVLSDQRSWVRRNAASGLVRHGDAGLGALVRALREPGRAGEAARLALFEVGLGKVPDRAREAS